MKNTISFKKFKKIRIEAYILEKYGRDELRKFRKGNFKLKIKQL